MFTDKLREWVRACPYPLRVSLIEAWNTAGVRVGEPDGQPVIRLGRAAAVLRPDGRVETTAFMRQNPLSQCMLEGLREAAWNSTGGAVFNERPRTGDANPLDSGGMHAAAGGWADFMGTLRMRLLAHEMQLGLLPWLEDAPTISAGFGLPAPAVRRIEISLARELVGLLSEEFTSAAAIALAQWRQKMPVRLMLAMDDAGWNSPERWNWLVNDLKRPQPRRLQAVEIFPWAAEFIRSKALLRTVDEGRPLVEALAGVHSVSVSVVKRLRGMPYSNATPTVLALALSTRAVDEGHTIPSTRGGWTCWSIGAAAARRRGMFFGDGNWDALDTTRFLRAMENVEDAARELVETLLNPLRMLLGPTLPEPDVLENACIWASPQRAMEVVEAWVVDNGQIRRNLMRDWPSQVYQSLTEPWQALHEPWDSGYGLRATALVDEKQLENESERMNHCVRDYGRRCRLSGIHIVSWRNAEGQSVATQELAQEVILNLAGTRTEAFSASRGIPPGTVQLQGPWNMPAPDKAFLAIWAHASALATGALSVEASVLRNALTLRQIHRNESKWADMVGWDVGAPGAARAALRAYAPLLSKKSKEALERALRVYERQHEHPIPEVT